MGRRTGVAARTGRIVSLGMVAAAALALVTGAGRERLAAWTTVPAHGTVVLRASARSVTAGSTARASVTLRPSWGAVSKLRLTLALVKGRGSAETDRVLVTRTVLALVRRPELVPLTWHVPRLLGARDLRACVVPRPASGARPTCSALLTVHLVAPNVASGGGIGNGPPSSGGGTNPITGPLTVAAPTLNGTSPASPNSSLRPTFTGTAPASEPLTLYATADCTGPAVGTATSSSAGALAIAIDHDVAFGATSTYSAAVTGNDVSSPCSASITYTHLGEVVDELATKMFSPAQLQIAAGTMVRWHDDSGVPGPHTVTSTGTPSFASSGPMSVGDNWDVVFPAAGTYTYQCAYHAVEGMTGEIDVT